MILAHKIALDPNDVQGDILSQGGGNGPFCL